MFCVFPSIVEGWGLGASEALDFGTPVVISDIPPLREATQGLMPAIPPADEDLWQETVEGLIAQPDALQCLRRVIAEKYRRRRVADFVDDVVARLSALLPDSQSFVEKHRGPGEKAAWQAVTSIPPPRPNQSLEAIDRARSRLARSIASFSANGFQVVSVNHAAEIPALEGTYDDVAFVTGTQEGLFRERYGPSFGSIFDTCRGTRLCAVLNADVYLVKGRITAMLEQNPGKFYVARRVDIVDYGEVYVGTYTRGIDAFFFWPEYFSALMADPNIARLQLGAPMWDIAVPVIASFHGDVEFIEPPFLFHPIHPMTWSRPDYARLRMFCADAILDHARAMAGTSLNARRLLHVIEARLGQRPRISRRRGAKLVMRLANFWLRRIEISQSVRVDVDGDDPVLRAALRGLNAGSAELAESGRETRAHRRSQPIEAFWAALRRWNRARQTKRLNRLFDEAERYYPAS